MKSYTKSQLAHYADVSPRTLSRWLSHHQDHLLTLGVTKYSRILPPRAVTFICNEYGIDINPTIYHCGTKKADKEVSVH